MRVGEVEPDYAQWRDLPAWPFSPILSRALESFYENGYHGATIRDLAKRVGVTVPAIYYHHESKEELLFALLDTSISHLVRICEAASADAEPGLATFDNLVEAIVRYTARSGKVAHLDSEMRSLSPEHREVYVGKRAAVEGMLRQSVEDGLAQGSMEVAQSRSVTRAILGMIQAISTWYHQDGRMTVDELAADYLVHARRMVGATRP